MGKRKVPEHFLNAFNAVVNIYGLGRELSASIQQFNVFLKSTVVPNGPTNTESRMYFGRGDPNDPAAKFQYAPKFAFLLEKSEPNGVNDQLQYALCVSYIFSLWDHQFRPGIAKAEGVDQKMVSHPALGDLRKIRNAILHRGHILDGGLEHFDIFKRGCAVQFDNESYYLILRGIFDGVKAIAEEFDINTAEWVFDRSIGS